MAKRGPETHHVVPNSDRGGWDVRRGGADRASGHYGSKEEAVNAGRDMSRNQHTELRIHNRDGKISSSDSHEHDPRNIKG